MLVSGIYCIGRFLHHFHPIGSLIMSCRLPLSVLVITASIIALDKNYACGTFQGERTASGLNARSAIHEPDDRDQDITTPALVRSYPKISRVIYHGNRAINDRDLTGRLGINIGDPLNDLAIEMARIRLLEFYCNNGFKQVTVTIVRENIIDPNCVILHINEGRRQRDVKSRQPPPDIYKSRTL